MHEWLSALVNTKKALTGAGPTPAKTEDEQLELQSPENTNNQSSLREARIQTTIAL